jgi:hypothetical protein
MPLSPSVISPKAKVESGCPNVGHESIPEVTSVAKGVKLSTWPDLGYVPIPRIGTEATPSRWQGQEIEEKQFPKESDLGGQQNRFPHSVRAQCESCHQVTHRGHPPCLASQSLFLYPKSFTSHLRDRSNLIPRKHSRQKHLLYSVTSNMDPHSRCLSNLGESPTPIPSSPGCHSPESFTVTHGSSNWKTSSEQIKI